MVLDDFKKEMWVNFCCFALPCVVLREFVLLCFAWVCVALMNKRMMMDSDGDDGDGNDGDDYDNHDNDHDGDGAGDGDDEDDDDDGPTNIGFFETGGSVWDVGAEWKKMVGMPGLLAMMMGS